VSDDAAAAVAAIGDRYDGPAPRVGIVLGSGLGGFVERLDAATAIPYSDLPGFPQPTVGGHSGRLMLGTLAGVPVMVMQGRAHYYEAGRSDGMRVPLASLRALGGEILLLTNAAGSLRTETGPGDLMLITDHINFGGRNPLIGERDDSRFVDMSEAYDRNLRQQLSDIAAELDITLHQGVYMWFSGPSFETPAEIRAARALGADAVGMSTVPEVILARHLGLRVAAVSAITNLAAGMARAPISHAQTQTLARQALVPLERLLAGVVEALA
jgi:purine-nucleoside phosphorylase